MLQASELIDMLEPDVMAYRNLYIAIGDKVEPLNVVTILDEDSIVLSSSYVYKIDKPAEASEEDK